MSKNQFSLFKELNERFFDELMPKDFEIARCIFCPGSPHHPIFEKETMEVVRCRCGFVYSRNQPKQACLDAFYRKSKPMEVWSEIKKGDFTRQYSKFERAVKIIAKSKVTSVLDVGCGNGTFLSLLLKERPSIIAHGLETNENAIKVAKAGGAFIVDQTLDGFLKFNNRPYDVITLWGVLEHLKDPLGYLLKLKGHLTKNGMVLVCVPNANSRVVRSLWDKAYTFCHQHLWYFDPDSLEKAFTKSGYKMMDHWTIEGEALPWLKHQWGFDPYKEAPQWAVERYFQKQMIKAFDENFVNTKQGYKVVAIATSL